MVDDRVEVWRFQDGVVPIKDMSTLEVLYASLHAMKKLHFYFTQQEYASYRIKTSLSADTANYYEGIRTWSGERTMFFSHKLNVLGRRAHEMGFEIPEKFKDVKEMINTINNGK